MSYSGSFRVSKLNENSYFREGDEGNLSIWNHLRGINKTVISKPDLRFHCTGEDFSRKNNLGLLNITEVFKMY